MHLSESRNDDPLMTSVPEILVGFIVAITRAFQAILSAEMH